MSSSFFEGAYFVGVVLASFIRVVYTRHYRKMAIADNHRTVADALLVSLPALGMFILPIIYVLTPWLDFADYQLPSWGGWIGVVLLALAIWLLRRSHSDLARNWSPRLELLEGHSLVTHGVFRHIAASDVRGPLAMGHRSGLSATELDRRLQHAGDFPPQLPIPGPVPGPGRGRDDDRPLRRCVLRLHGAHRQNHTPTSELVTCTGQVADPPCMAQRNLEGDDRR